MRTAGKLLSIKYESIKIVRTSKNRNIILLLARTSVMSDKCVSTETRISFLSGVTMTYLLSGIEINGSLSNHATQC